MNEKICPISAQQLTNEKLKQKLAIMLLAISSASVSEQMSTDPVSLLNCGYYRDYSIKMSRIKGRTPPRSSPRRRGQEQRLDQATKSVYL